MCSSVCSVGMSTTLIFLVTTIGTIRRYNGAKPKARKIAFVFTSSVSFVRPRWRHGRKGVRRNTVTHVSKRDMYVCVCVCVRVCERECERVV